MVQMGSEEKICLNWRGNWIAPYSIAKIIINEKKLRVVNKRKLFDKNYWAVFRWADNIFKCWLIRLRSASWNTIELVRVLWWMHLSNWTVQLLFVLLHCTMHIAHGSSTHTHTHLHAIECHSMLIYWLENWFRWAKCCDSSILCELIKWHLLH